jgi:hypothetical protein
VTGPTTVVGGCHGRVPIDATGLDIISRGLTLVLDDARVLEVSATVFDGLYEHRRRTVLGERLG